MTDLRRLKLHELFNIINLGKPIFFADIRTKTCFEECNFRNSHSILDDTLEQLHKLVEVSKINIICVFDNAAEISVDSLFGWVDAINPVRIISKSICDFEEFYATYPKCEFLYRGNKIPCIEGRIRSREYPTDIIPQCLYLGNKYDAKDPLIVSDLGITHIIDATGAKESKSNAESLGIAYLPIHIWDIETANITDFFEEVFRFIDEARLHTTGKVLVHCQAGISRSSTLVLAYLIRSRYATSLREAVSMVLPERPFVWPNEGFRRQLVEFEQRELQKASFEDDPSMLEYIESFNQC